MLLILGGLIVTGQLQKAGVRLARKLDTAFEK